MNGADLFAGLGGLSLGLKNAGINIVAAYENWQEAADVYRANFDHEIIQVDLAGDLNFEIFTRYNLNLIAGGPPCQDFSNAGKRDENLGRADLTFKFAQIVCTVRPTWFVMENVSRVRGSKVLEKSLKLYKDAGYGITWKVVDTSYCGVPQKRLRYILVGKLEEEDEFLKPYLEMNLSKTPLTVRIYFQEQLKKELGIQFYYRHPRSYARRGIFSIDEPSPSIRGTNRPLPKQYKRHTGDACDPSDNVRELTYRERSLIQTFPEDFILKGYKSDLEKMIGNAVPVKLGEYIGKCILQYTRDSEAGTVLKPAKKKRATKQASTQLPVFQ